MTSKNCFCSGRNNSEKCQNCGHDPNGAASQEFGLGEGCKSVLGVGGDEQFGGPGGAGGPGQCCQGGQVGQGRGDQGFNGTEGRCGPGGRGGPNIGQKKCHCRGKNTGEKCKICGHDPGGAGGLLACGSRLIPLMVFTTGSILTMQFAVLAAEIG